MSRPLMLSIQHSRFILDFLDKKTCVTTFEKWVYSEIGLESELSSECYLACISLNFKSPQIYHDVLTLLDQHIDYGSVHKEDIIAILNRMLAQQEPLSDLLHLIYKYCELGYEFLAANIIIANFGEQGKSIVHKIHGKPTIEQYDIALLVDPEFLNWLEVKRNKIISGKYIFTGKKVRVNSWAVYFEYTEA